MGKRRRQIHISQFSGLYDISVALWQFPLFIYFTSIRSPVALSRFCLYTPALAPVASRHCGRQRWPSCPWAYPQDSALLCFAWFSYKLHVQHFYYSHERFSCFIIPWHQETLPDIQLHIVPSELDLSQFQEEKQKKNLLFQWVHTFPLPAHGELPANLMKTLVTGKLLQTNKKAGHDFSLLLFPNFLS